MTKASRNLSKNTNIFENKIDETEKSFVSKTGQQSDFNENQTISLNTVSEHSMSNTLPTSMSFDVTFKITEYFKEEFEGLRKLFDVSNENFYHSLASSKCFETSGGKSDSDFMISVDGKVGQKVATPYITDQYVVKAINSKEIKHFLQFAKDYINYMKQRIQDQRPSYLCLVYGAFKVREQSYIIMENLKNFAEGETGDLKTYDLKGSEINRFQTKLKAGSTIQDTNFLIERNGEPVYLKGLRVSNL